MRSELPTGTVTFLFTDIEGSTRLLNELGPERYADALGDHRRLLRDAFGRHGGVEVDTQGDAFFYAFARASDALAAAEAGQRALDGPVRVRIGVHTGEPVVTAEGYVGGDVHVAARVMGAGHGGQVLASEATARLVDAALRDLGEHRLKDVERPVRLFQLGGGRFPPLRTLNNSNLPSPISPLLGRKKELADVLRLFRSRRARLVTVTGPGGIGKTRFALDAARELVEEFAHGVWFVDLSALRHPALVVPTIGAALGAKDGLADDIDDKALLLVLDNFEQVADAAGEVAALLRRCPNVHVIATSRERLHVDAEREYPLKPLAESPAVELFRERAEAVEPEFDAPWQTLAAIVDRLDRLPLAIELAAARVKALRADDLLARLEQRLPLLTSRARDLPERQRTLRATIDWSHDLLDAEERRLFRRLAVFPGGCTLDTADAVCDADLDVLESLVTKNLVRHDDGRYTMLETIREYAQEQLERSDERDEVATRHAESVLHLVERAQARQRDDEIDFKTWLEVLTRHQHDVLAALTFFERSGTDDALLRVAAAVLPLWHYAFHADVGVRWLDRGLARTQSSASSSRTRALVAAAALRAKKGETERARVLANEAVEAARLLGERLLEAVALSALAHIQHVTGELEAAEETLLAVEALGRALGRERFVLTAASQRGVLALDRGALGEAKRAFEENLRESRRRGWRVGEAATRAWLGLVALHEGRSDDAERLFAASLRIQPDIMTALPSAIEGLAAVASRRNHWRRAAVLLAAAEARRDASGAAPGRHTEALRAEIASAIRAAATDVEEAAAVEQGRAMTLDEAVEYALSLDSS